jgi:8-oxo-dGTP pyrophosphatase MutT (NUDIX family)
MSQPVVVKAIIHDQNGRFLLQHRDNIAGIAAPNCWSFFGGGVDEGETLIEALERELQEELSCKVGQIEKELFRWHPRPDGVLHVCFAVRFTASNDELILMEGQDFAWFSLGELVDLPLGLLVQVSMPHLLILDENSPMYAPISLNIGFKNSHLL